MKKRIFSVLLCAMLMIGLLPMTAVTTTAEVVENVAVLSAAEPERYGYTTLSGNPKYVYEQLEAGVNRTVPLETIPLDSAMGVSLDDVRHAISVFIGDYPECFWLRNKYSYAHNGGVIVSIVPTYSFTGDALIEARIKFNSALQSFMADLPEGDNYEKALYLHDLLAKRVAYEMVGEHQTAYGALVDGKAVCAGYAVAYHLLLKEAGIRACTLSGVSYDPNTGAAVNHAWNVLWLDAETCVYTDVTWDDQGDDLYHYYFNLSLSEISTDHIVNVKYDNNQVVEANYFTLPECDHDDQSYFDKNGHTVTEQSTVDEVAAMFGEEYEGKRSATICYTGSTSFSAWVEENLEDLYVALGGKVGSYNCTFNNLGKEIKVTVTGNFPKATYKVEISELDFFTTNGNLIQYVEIGDAMDTVVLRLTDGWYFPEDYGGAYIWGGGVDHTLSVERLDYTRVAISGIPYADATIVLKTPERRAVMLTPQVTFTATGADSGVLTGVETGMRYTMDGENWVDIVSEDDLILNDLEPCSIALMRVGNGTTTADSMRQLIMIYKRERPNLTATQLSVPNGGGSIPTTAMHEYSTDGKTWQACNGELTGLSAGTYYVRARASGTMLASDAQTVVIYPYGEVPPVDGNPTADGGATGGSGGSGTKSSGCFAFTLGVEETALILTCLTAVLLGKKKLFAKAK